MVKLLQRGVITILAKDTIAIPGVVLAVVAAAQPRSVALAPYKLKVMTIEIGMVFLITPKTDCHGMIVFAFVTFSTKSSNKCSVRILDTN
jgi:hypothetical protein